MGYFDGLINGKFKTDKKGNTLFYKWGVFGIGYLVPNTDKESEIRKFLMLFYKVSFLCLFVCAIVRFNLLIALFLGIPLYVWYHIKISPILMGLTVSHEKLTLEEMFKNIAWGKNKFTLRLSLIFWIFMFFCGLFILSRAKDLEEQLIAASCIIFCGAISTVFIYMLETKRN